MGYSPWRAQVLSDPKTPAKFADERAFGNYLASLRNAEFAAAWAGGKLPRFRPRVPMTP